MRMERFENSTLKIVHLKLIDQLNWNVILSLSLSLSLSLCFNGVEHAVQNRKILLINMEISKFSKTQS